MVKLTTLFRLALVACTSAIPTVLKDTTQASTNATSSCMCTGQLMGNFCGGRAEEKDVLRKPINGTCNAISLYYCSPWAAKTAGMADIVQNPCWTNKCWPSVQSGSDSCTLPVTESSHGSSVESSSKAKHPVHTNSPKNGRGGPSNVTIPPCVCTANLTGHFCGEHAHEQKFPLLSQKPITGGCNATSLYFCSLWAARTAGLADAVQSPCWTNKCYSSASKIGSDSCTPPAGSQSQSLKTPQPSKIAKPHKAEREELHVASALSPSSIKSAGPSKHSTHTVITVIATGLPTDPCLCNGFVGHFCGFRAHKKSMMVPGLQGNCAASTLYWCSLGISGEHNSTDTSNHAQVVQSPCHAKKCYGNDSGKIKAGGSDSCSPPNKSPRDILQFEDRTPLSSFEDSSSSTPDGVTDCTCGSLSGHFCGERASDGDGNIKGHCNATSLYYCSPWAVKTSGLADQVQNPCWTKHCHQAKNPGYDSCNPIKSEIVSKDGSVSESKSLPKPFTSPVSRTSALIAKDESSVDVAAKSKKCRCGKQLGAFCGNRTLLNPYKNDAMSLSGNCDPKSIYLCTAKHGRSPAARRDCAGLCKIDNKSWYADDDCNSPDEDFDGEDDFDEEQEPVTTVRILPTLIAKDEDANDAASKSKKCRCGSLPGYFCGNATVPSGQALNGNCNPESLYFCSSKASQKKGKPVVIAEKCAGQCKVDEGDGTFALDSCPFPEDFFLEPTVPTVAISPAAVARDMSAGDVSIRDKADISVPANPLPVCTCGKDSGFFCGDRSTSAVKKNEQRALTGNCTAGALYHCEDTTLTSPHTAKIWENPCGGSSKCYQSVETGYDSCHH